MAEIPTQNTTPPELLRFWLEELKQIEEKLRGDQDYLLAKERLRRWMAKAVASIARLYNRKEASALSDLEARGFKDTATRISFYRTFLTALLEDADRDDITRKYEIPKIEEMPSTNPPTSDELPNDSILLSRYKILSELGKGGTGKVYLASDLRLDRTVAIKELTIEGDDLRRSLIRESKLLANLHHPCLPAVIDSFEIGGRPFFVMEFIRGKDLAGLLQDQNEPFPQIQVLRWCNDLLDLLDYLHSQNDPIIHRDIKPANLKLTEQHRIVLLDFGLSKGSAGQMKTLVDTETSIFGYTPAYASPEQIHRTGTDEKSDLFSLAATLYHLLTGNKAPSSAQRFAAVQAKESDPLRPAHEINPSISLPFSDLLMRTMQLNPRERPSCAEIRQTVQELLISFIDSDLKQVEISDADPADKPRAEIVDSDLTFALEVDREVRFKERRTTWRTTEEGVVAASESVNRLFEELTQLAKKSNEVLETIHLAGFRPAENQFMLCGRGLCLFLVWDCPYANTLDGSRLIVEIYQGKFDFSTGSPVRMNKDRKYQGEYSFDMDSSLEIGWQRKGSDRHLLQSDDFARSCMSNLLSSIRNETGTP